MAKHARKTKTAHFALMLTASIIVNVVFFQPGILAFSDPTTPSTAVEENSSAVVPPETDTTSGNEAPEAPTEMTTPTAATSPTMVTTPAVTAPVITYNNDGFPLIESYPPIIPDSVLFNLQYQKYLTNYDYGIPQKGAGIRKGPGGAYDFIRKPSLYEKISLVDTVHGEYIAAYDSDVWHQVYWYDKTGFRTGYIFGPLLDVRHYQFERKLNEAKTVQRDLASAGRIGFVDNYKNKKGIPPRLPGGVDDAFGNNPGQSAPGYSSPTDLTDFIYIQDGTLLIIIGENDKYYQCRLPGKDTVYWTPKKYITISSTMNNVNQFIVIDRTQQNATVFQKLENRWELISYQAISTGARDKYRYPTPLGAFMAIERRTKFNYVNDITQEIEGYCPHVIRFTAGAYIHGVPVTYKKDPETGALTDPGKIENLLSLGTYPRTHKCVRTTTSHAKFLYDWVDIGHAAFVVIE